MSQDYNGHPRAAIAIAAPPAPIISSTSNIAISAPGCAKAANSWAKIFFIRRKQQTDEGVPAAGARPAGQYLSGAQSRSSSPLRSGSGAHGLMVKLSSKTGLP